MKITKQLLINNNPSTLIEDHIRLEMNTPGRCVLSMKSTSEPLRGQLLEINGKLSQSDLRRLFYGYIETVTPKQNGVYKIVGRELAAILNQRIALNLRHVTPNKVLEAISFQTKTRFILPKSEWTNKTIARFQHIGGGYMALDNILKLWNVQRGFWHQQADGQIFIGECAKSVPGQKKINIPASIFSAISVQGGTLPLLPRLRPGVQIEMAGQVFYINSIDIEGENMRLNWLINPWETTLKAIQ